MGEEFKSTQAIYQQIIDKLCRQMVRGHLQPGEKLPSVRELAVQIGVNPNTIQRVYQEMERLGLVETRRGQGTFVSEDISRLTRLREELQEERVRSFVEEMTEMGFSPEEIAAGMERYWRNGRVPEGSQG